MALRRGVGVAHVQRTRQHRDTMADLGAAMSAERIAGFADQLDEMKRKFFELLRTHERVVATDAIVRAKFRKLADALGINFCFAVSAATLAKRSEQGVQDREKDRANAFMGAIKAVFLDGSDASPTPADAADFTTPAEVLVSIGCDAVEACLEEQSFYGSLIPSDAVVRAVNRKRRQTASLLHVPHSDLGPDDVRKGLTKLRTDLHDTAYRWIVVAATTEGSDALLTPFIAVTPSRNESTPALFGRREDAASIVAFALHHVRQRDMPIASRPLRGAASSQPPASRVVHDRISLRPSLGPTTVVEPPPQREASVGSNAPLGVTIDELLAVPLFSLWPRQRVESALRLLLLDGTVWLSEGVGDGTAPSYWFVGASAFFETGDRT